MKQVPAGTKVDIDPETGAMKRLSGDTRTNPYDLFALETALQLREKLGGTVTVLTMGQIGLSGRTVRPRLIITCGVSGAIQFTSCMKDAECIVAINSDPDALIFKTAHYCIVDDLYQVVPRLTALVQNRKED